MLIELLQPLQLLEETTTPIADVDTSAFEFATSRALMPQLPTGQMAQIQSLDVDCSKDSMVVKMRFDRVFTGLIYSKVRRTLQNPRDSPAEFSGNLPQLSKRSDQFGIIIQRVGRRDFGKIPRRMLNESRNGETRAGVTQRAVDVNEWLIIDW